MKFTRYSATGNTFLIADNRNGEATSFSFEQLKKLAQGNKVDGLLFVETPSDPTLDFHMRYLNADGGEVEMCGNGARAILHFVKNALHLEPKAEVYCFSTLNSTYEGKGETNYPVRMTELKDLGLVSLENLVPCQFHYYLNTGVPHALFEVEGVEKFDVEKHGEFVRFHSRFVNGVNANFFEVLGPNQVRLRTYERGVDGETDSCGTGATALALTLAKFRGWGPVVEVKVNGGSLKISFDSEFSEVYLEGPVESFESIFFDNK